MGSCGAVGIGVDADGGNVLPASADADRVKIRLMLLGFPVENFENYVSEVVTPVVPQIRAAVETRGPRCRADGRIEEFCRNYFIDLQEFGSTVSFLPASDFVCDRHGVARMLSLPEKSDEFHCEYVDSYRIYNGILHNPSTDKRTTKDSFHIAEGGLPVPSDKLEVPKIAFARMLQIAFHPNDEMLVLPFTSEQREPAKLFVSNYMKPVVCPKMGEIQRERRMEIRFFVPGTLVSILDCTESIFGNAGSPFSPENDAALDPTAWTGHTGCIVFAPQLRKCTKKSLGLPHIGDATERQRRDGMCWEDEGELYHNGRPFRIMARDGGGVMVSIVADSYNGYGKKEIKTQISYAANMSGMCEEEHSGGTLVFPRYDLGDKFNYRDVLGGTHNFENTLNCCSGFLDLRDGFAVDKNFQSVIYVHESARFSLPDLSISCDCGGNEINLPLELEKTYILPSGYRVNLGGPDGRGGRWKLIGTSPDGIFCYKPSTVSGGGKSEIAKPIGEFISFGPTIICDYCKSFELVDEILGKDFSGRFKNDTKSDTRKLLDDGRSLGSVIKLLTPSDYYTDEYNGWLATIPQCVLELIFAIKRFHKSFDGEDWKTLFTVDSINGKCGNELRYRNEKLFEHYLRIGFDRANHWRLFSLRDDFIPSVKFQLADDITAVTTVPTNKIRGTENSSNRSVKIVHNCEYRLYQRPDEAVIPGYDPGSEFDMTRKNIFTCNFKALTRDDVRQMMRNRIKFEMYSEPMKEMLANFADDETAPRHAVCPSELRPMADGKVSKNQRYLQNRNDICNGLDAYLATVSSKLWKGVGGDFSIAETPVSDILSGRRNNPPEDGVKPLCVYGPLHYMDLPELFLEYLSSVTGKSPSTTGAGLEGAMTKGPFNSLSSVYDLNASLLSFILSGYSGFLSAAGYVGPHVKVAHDITYLLPEIWCRMTTEERSSKFLIEHKYLERCENFEHNGRVVCAERLGYRITRKFVRVFAGRVFSMPDTVFSDEMLRPETQDVEIFAESMDAILDAHRRAASLVIENAGIEIAIPPLRALLHIAANGKYNGMTLGDENFRALFSRENVLASDWYADRLKKYQASQIEHLSNGLECIRNFRKIDPDFRPDGEDALARELDFARTDGYVNGLIGTIGRD
ncbi:MAG: hypothetical protein LBB18_01400 [Puniceicoccales bacterium]|jgi:hypothetical protein|nr:hypothetical protein [Puniceicoccales bacterium]